MQIKSTELASGANRRYLSVMNNLSGKTYAVIGATSGIGSAVIAELDKQGAGIIATGRGEAPPPSLPSVSEWHSWQVGDEPPEFPTALDGLVYCPGTINLKPFKSLKDKDFIDDFEVNLLGAVQILRKALPALKKADESSVVLFSTVAVQTGLSFHASIAAAKGAVEGLTRSLAAEFAPERIRVNAVAPSLTDTPLAARLISDDKRRETSADRHPLGRIGTPEDIAAAVLYLLGSASGWVTGQILAVDGGISSVRPL